jgi:hypothetical protein
MQVTVPQHEAHTSSASAVFQAAYQSIESRYNEAFTENYTEKTIKKSSIDFSHLQKIDAEVGKIIEVITNTTFDLLRKECPRVTSITDVAFNQSSSLCGDDIIDILKDDSEYKDKFKELLEECLLAKKIVMCLFDKVASEFEDYDLDKDDAIAIYNEMFLRVVKDNAMIYFPLLLKQKLLVTACKHPSKKVFGKLEIPVVDAFAVDGKVYPTIFDMSYAADELNDMASGALRGYLMNETTSPNDWTITSGPLQGHGIYKEGLITDDYPIIDNKYMEACHVASFILQTAFTKFGKFHVKSVSGIKEKLLFRQKCVDDILRITVNYGEAELMDEEVSLMTKMRKVERKLARLGLTFISKAVTKTGKSKFIYSFTLSRKNRIAENYPMWLEVQFWSFDP